VDVIEEGEGVDNAAVPNKKAVLGRKINE